MRHQRLKRNRALVADVSSWPYPACDAIPAWISLIAETRTVFREAAGFDDATWARGRGWALTFVSALTYYRYTNPYMAALRRRAIDEVLADQLARS